jgi:hypothetical protein
MKNRSLRLSSAALAIGLVVGGIAVSMPTASSAAPAKPAVVRGHAPKFTLTQLLNGLFFGVGPVGKLANISGKETAATPTTNESKVVKAFVTALGPAAQDAAIAAELQSGNTSSFSKAVSSIDAKDSALGSTSGLSAAATVQERANVAKARVSLGSSGDMGRTCAASVAPGSVACAQNPAVRPATGDNNVAVAIQVVAVVWVAVAIVIFGVLVAIAPKGNPNGPATVKQIARLTKALAA